MKKEAREKYKAALPVFAAILEGTKNIRSNMMNRYLHYDDIEIDEIGFSYLAGASLCEMARERGISIGMVRTRLKRFFEYYDEKSC